ncbi:hypothetical protein [Moorella sulfitireducens (nom. illeg.)]|uniref:hypothetical protein n=1 Tax=Neomoorella sulfitireducens TaxID=2972948 RepID=UPI0021ABDE1E|nr:hypothetical protein [Moorella sulfitireducens]
MEKINFLEMALQLLTPQQQHSLSFNELAGLLALVDLLGILNLLQDNVAVPARAGTGNAVQEALNAVLGQGSGGSVKPPADLISLLGKNPALLTTLMNMLMSARESKGAKEKEAGETAPAQQNTPLLQSRGNLPRNT